MEPASGIEPPTYGLRNRCSTTELRRLSQLDRLSHEIGASLLSTLLIRRIISRR